MGKTLNRAQWKLVHNSCRVPYNDDGDDYDQAYASLSAASGCYEIGISFNQAVEKYLIANGVDTSWYTGNHTYSFLYSKLSGHKECLYGNNGVAQYITPMNQGGSMGFPTMTMLPLAYGTIGGGEWVFSVHSKKNSPWGYPLKWRRVLTNDINEMPTGAYQEHINNMSTGATNSDGHFTIGGASGYNYMNVEVQYYELVYGLTEEFITIELTNTEAPEVPVGWTIVEAPFYAYNRYALSDTCLTTYQNAITSSVITWFALRDEFVINGGLDDLLNGEWGNGEWSTSSDALMQHDGSNWHPSQAGNYISAYGNPLEEEQAWTDFPMSGDYLVFDRLYLNLGC